MRIYIATMFLAALDMIVLNFLVATVTILSEKKNVNNEKVSTRVDCEYSNC